MRYPRYDLAFLGDEKWERGVLRFAVILAEEGFGINHRKTRVMRQGGRVRARIAPRIPSFREHLAGRVGFVAMVNPAKGARLRRLLDEVECN